MTSTARQTHMASGNGESVISTTRRSSNPLDPDIEKGPANVSDFSEDEKFGDSVTSPELASKPEKSNSEKKDEGGTKKQVVKKHWEPGQAWFVLVLLGLGACWIPAILAWTKFPGARVWGVELLFWSIWLSILWAGWWFALVLSWVGHRVLLIFVRWFDAWRLKRYVNWLEYLHGYLAFVAWSAALWITWVPLIVDRQLGNNGDDSNDRSVRAVNLGGRLLFAFAGCATILLAEKVVVQWIAMKFHGRSYQKRIEAQKEAVEAFKILFSLIDKDPNTSNKHGSFLISPSRIPSRFSSIASRPFSSDERYNYNHHIIDRAPTSKLQTAFTDVTGQIFGTSQLDNDDVVGAFHRDGSGKMRILSQKIWDGLAKKSGEPTSFRMTKSLIERVRDDVPDAKPANEAFSTGKIWSVVTGGFPHPSSISEEEFMHRCSELHAEQRRLEETMNDLQNVVGRLDDVLMLFWVVGSILILSVALEAELKNIILGAGSAFIGASWLLRDLASEVVSSIIFIFSKHPFDVEDQVVIKGKRYTVVEVRLLSTVFHDDGSVQVQAPNSLLNTMFIHNLRRSPATSEPFIVEVNDQTTEAQLNDFQAHMSVFLKAHPKAYRADFEVTIKELSFQSSKMVLSMDIKYNNNWESKAVLRAKRRNAWICSARECLGLAGIRSPETPGLRVTTITENAEKLEAT